MNSKNTFLSGVVAAGVLAATMLSLTAPASAVNDREFVGPVRPVKLAGMAFRDRDGFERRCHAAHIQVVSSGVYEVRRTDPDEMEPGHIAGYQARVKCKLRG
ncbi:hypothetical protein [Lentzea kentuckyensis]|uniref:hypothetical protein n=1 Tax=Lentzea kentuckyensis TaxID=360086 RepID=UPI000A3636EF|nr:hypothetical protein [Lentzea kentuckyensis]